MNTTLEQDNFQGDPEDLQAFLELVASPIRSQVRSEALTDWRTYKQGKLERLWREVAPDVFRAPPTALVIVEGQAVSDEPVGDRESSGEIVLYKGWNTLAMKEHLIDLSGANLEGVCIGYVDLRGVRLDGACLRGAWLKGAELEWASLRNADLSTARLLQADLTNAELEGADLSAADLSDTTFRNADLRGADLRDSDLSRSNLVGANLEGADLNGSRIYGVAAWDVSLCEDGTKRQNLIVTPPEGSEVRVDDLEVAQFIYLLLNRKKLRNVIDAVTQRGVLILGAFNDGGLELLQMIAAWLRQPDNGGYLPLLFDFPRPDSKTYTETVRTLAGLARFVIVELSGASVPQEITATVDLYGIPFVAITQEDDKEWSMFKDFLVNDRVIGPIRFRDERDLLDHLATTAIAPAEKMIEHRQKKLREIFSTQ